MGSESAIDFVGGLFGGCAGLVVGHAFDTIKVRQQTLNPSQGKGAYAAIRTTIVHDGLLGFYKGMAFPLVTVGGLNSLYFGVYGNTIRSLANYRYGEGARASYLDVFLVGGFAGAIQAVPACTIELAKIKLQAQSNAGIPGAAISSRYRGPISSVVFMIHRDHGLHGIFSGISSRKGLSRHKTLMQPRSCTPEAPTLYRGPLHCLQSMYAAHGVRGCLRGLQATLMREVPGLSVYMVSYEYFCDRLTPGRESFLRATPVVNTPSPWGEGMNSMTRLPDPTVSTLLIAGGLAGTLSWLGNIPFDVIKSRLQADNLASPRYKNYWDCVVKSYKSDGFRVFWRGLPVVCIRAFPVNAVTFAVYSTSVQVMQRMYKDRNMDTADNIEQIL